MNRSSTQKIFLLILTAILLLSATCSLKTPEESEKPSWNIDLNLPLYQNTFYADDLLEDSLFTVGKNSIYTFDTTYSFEKKNIGELEIDPFTAQNSKKLGNFEINNFSQETDPIQLDEVFTGLQSSPSGLEITIPEDTDIPKITRTITFEKFKQVTFASGKIILKIDNNLPIELGRPLNAKIKNANNDSVILETDKWDASNGDSGILPGENSSDTLDLSGKTLPNNIKIVITGDLCGSGPDTFVDNQENRESSFSVITNSQNLKASSAEAIIPAQSIEKKSSISLPVSEFKIKKAKFKTVSLEINLDNNMALNQQLNFRIPDIVSDSETDTFSTNLDIEKNQSITKSYDLDNYKLLLDDIDNQIINYHFKYQLSSNGEMVHLESSDNIVASVSIFGQNKEDQISFESIEGNIAKDNAPAITIDNISKQIEVFPEEAKGINLSNVDMVINLETNLEAKFGLNLQVKAFNKEGQSKTLTVNKIINTQDSSDSNFQIKIDKAEKLININPNQISASGEAYVFGKNVKLKYNQYIDSQLGIIIPLSVTFNDTTEMKIDLEPQKVDNQDIPDNLISGTLKYKTNNAFDFGTILDLYASRDSSKIGTNKQDTLIDGLKIEYNNSFEGEVILDEKDIDLFENSFYIKPNIHLIGEDTSQIYKNDSLKVIFWGKFKGKIDTSVYEGN